MKGLPDHHAAGKSVSASQCFARINSAGRWFRSQPHFATVRSASTAMPVRSETSTRSRSAAASAAARRSNQGIAYPVGRRSPSTPMPSSPTPAVAILRSGSPFPHWPQPSMISASRRSTRSSASVTGPMPSSLRGDGMERTCIVRPSSFTNTTLRLVLPISIPQSSGIYPSHYLQHMKRGLVNASASLVIAAPGRKPLQILAVHRICTCCTYNMD